MHPPAPGASDLRQPQPGGQDSHSILLDQIIEESELEGEEGDVAWEWGLRCGKEHRVGHDAWGPSPRSRVIKRVRASLPV